MVFPPRARFSAIPHDTQQCDPSSPSSPSLSQPPVLSRKTHSPSTPRATQSYVNHSFCPGQEAPLPTSCVLPGSDPSGQALVDLGQQQGTSFTWKVNVAAGTQIGLTIRDSNGSVAQTAPFSINSGSDSSCVGKPVSESTGPTGSGSAPSTGAPSGSTPAGSTAPTTRPATSGTAPTTTTGASSASRSSGSASASATTRNAAVGTVAKVGTAGFVGVAVAALLA
ncbi:hypothetical protein AX17_002345 [Amanita inopinata Kibby_2008]|nr:hypothetical protein AX17_002345 [Amanita inopinata Kibby_2008]